MGRKVIVDAPRLTEQRLARVAPPSRREERGGEPAPALPGLPVFTLPRRLGIFCRNYEHGDAIPRLPIYVRAILELVPDVPDQATAPVISEMRVALGYLASDHAGYLSFDLDPLRDIDTVEALMAGTTAEDGTPSPLRVRAAFECRPFDDDTLAFDVRLDDPAHDVGPEIVIAHYAPDISELLGRSLDLPMSSIQNPSIIDWRVSPSSFASSSNRLIGADGCEEMMPSNLAVQRFALFQPVFLGPTRPSNPHSEEFFDGRLLVPREITYGAVLDYRTDWFPAGHSLGQVQYSLALAPAEKVKLAVVDWSRTDTATRTEQTGQGERLASTVERDRTVSEVMGSMVREKQKGKSFSGGLSIAGPLGDFMGSLSLGGARTSSSGLRSLLASSTQDVNDSIVQAATAFRELHSTTVVESGQAESGNFETRTIANYNHGHTLTVLYYEVIRHYRVVTRLTNRRPVVFVKCRFVSRWTESEILHRRHQLEPALLDRRLAVGFDAIARLRAARLRLADAQARFAEVSAGEDPALFSFTQFTLAIATGGRGTFGSVTAELMLDDGTIVRFRQVEPANQGADPFVLGRPPQKTTVQVSPQASTEVKIPFTFLADGFEVFTVDAETPVRWGQITGLRLRQSGGQDWDVRSLRLIGFQNPTTSLVIAETRTPQVVPEDSASPRIDAEPPNASFPRVAPRLGDFVTAEDQDAAARLQEHIAEFKIYYALAVAMGDEEQRALLLGEARLDPDEPLINIVDPTPVGIHGDQIIYELNDPADQRIRELLKITEPADDEVLEVYSEELAAVPTRGVFAEAKLGHCNACEVIDDTRFWDWQKSPIPDNAPEIAPVDTGSRFQTPQGLTPTTFAQPIVSVVTPQAAPDPSTAADAAGAVTKDIGFRDMSGIQQVTSTLQELVKATAGMVTAKLGVKNGPKDDGGGSGDGGDGDAEKAGSGAERVKATVTAREDGGPDGAEDTTQEKPREKDPVVRSVVERGRGSRPVKKRRARARRLRVSFTQAKGASPTVFDVLTLNVRSGNAVVASYQGPTVPGGYVDIEGDDLPDEGSIELTVGFGGPLHLSSYAGYQVKAHLETGYKYQAGSDLLEVSTRPEATAETLTISNSHDDIKRVIERVNELEKKSGTVNVEIETGGGIPLLLNGKGTAGVSGTWEFTESEGTDNEVGATDSTGETRAITILAYTGALEVWKITGGSVMTPTQP